MRKIFLVLSILFLYSCEDNIMGNSEIEFTFLDIYLETTLDENGYYHLEYTSTSEQVYQAVYFQTTSTQRVHWDSPNNLIINWNGFEFEQPIISYSTYADDWGNGQQLFFVDNTQVGDTLLIFGYVNEMAWDYLYFILEDNNE